MAINYSQYQSKMIQPGTFDEFLQNKVNKASKLKLKSEPKQAPEPMMSSVPVNTDNAKTYLDALEKNKLDLQTKLQSQPKEVTPVLNFGAPMSGSGITNFEDYKATIKTPEPTKPTTTSGFSLIPKASASDTNFIQTFLDDTKGKSDFETKRNAVIEMLKNGEDESFIEDAIINKMGYKGTQSTQQVQPQESKGFFESLKYTPYSQEEVTAYDPNKSTAQNVLEGQGRYLSNIAGGAYNIIPGLAELATSAVKGTAKDVGMQFGDTLGIVSDEEFAQYEKNQAEKTGQLLKGVFQDYANKYGSTEGFTKAVVEDPTAIVGDVLTVVGLGAAGKAKLNQRQLSKLEKQKALTINNMKNATTLEEKSAFLKQGIEQAKQIAQKEQQIKTAQDVASASFKYDPYVQVPLIAGKGVVKGAEKVVSTAKKLTPDLQQKAYDISTKANRFNAVDEEKFIKTTGQTPGQFAVERGMTEVGEKAVEKATKNYLESIKQADKSFENVGGNFKYTGKGNDPIKLSLDDLETRGLKTESDFTPRIQELKSKYETEGLTMPEINEVKREYARNFKYGFEDRNSEALARSTNIQNRLREWQLNKASEMGVSNIREINKNTQAWKIFADSLEKKLNRSGANNAVSITDWIALSGGNATNLALFLGKKLGTSDKAKRLLIKTFGKQTKEAIITPDINKPEIKGLLPRGAIITPPNPNLGTNIKITNVNNSNIPNNLNSNSLETKLKSPLSERERKLLKPEPQVLKRKGSELVSIDPKTGEGFDKNGKSLGIVDKRPLQNTLKGATTSNIDEVTQSVAKTLKTTKTAEIKAIIQRYLKEFGKDFKNKIGEMIDEISEKIGAKLNLISDKQGIGVEKTALLKGSDDLIKYSKDKITITGKGELNYEIGKGVMDIDLIKVSDKRQGIGTKLMKEAEKIAKEKGLKKIQLSAQKVGDTTLEELDKFYVKNGYIKDKYFDGIYYKIIKD